MQGGLSGVAPSVITGEQPQYNRGCYILFKFSRCFRKSHCGFKSIFLAIKQAKLMLSKNLVKTFRT